MQVQNHFFASAEAVLGLAAHLLVQTDQGGGELVLLLLHMGAGGEGEVDCLHLQECKMEYSYVTHFVLDQIIHRLEQSRHKA